MLVIRVISTASFTVKDSNVEGVALVFFIKAVALCKSAKRWSFFFLMVIFVQTEAYLGLAFLNYQQLIKLKFWHCLCISSVTTFYGGGKSKSGWFPTVHCGLHECVD